MNTSVGIPIDNGFLYNYFKALINRFFKILPIKEETPASLQVYLQSLQIELLGCEQLIAAINCDPMYITLLSVIQYLLDHPECSHKTTRREVFNAISACQKLQKRSVGTEVVV